MAGAAIRSEDGGAAYGVLGQKDFFSTLPNAPDEPSKLKQLSSPGGLAAVGNQLFIGDTLNNRLVVRAVPEASQEVPDACGARSRPNLVTEVFIGNDSGARKRRGNRLGGRPLSRIDQQATLQYGGHRSR